MNEIQRLTWSELNNLLEKANFSEEEEKVVRCMNRGMTATQISFELSMSEATVNRRKKGVREKMARSNIDKIPTWEKITMTLEEASEYSSIGIDKIRELVNDPFNNFTLYVGKKRLIKRKEFEDYIRDADRI